MVANFIPAPVQSLVALPAPAPLGLDEIEAARSIGLARVAVCLAGMEGEDAREVWGEFTSARYRLMEGIAQCLEEAGLSPKDVGDIFTEEALREWGKLSPDVAVRVLELREGGVLTTKDVKAIANAVAAEESGLIPASVMLRCDRIGDEKTAKNARQLLGKIARAEQTLAGAEDTAAFAALKEELGVLVDNQTADNEIPILLKGFLASLKGAATCWQAVPETLSIPQYEDVISAAMKEGTLPDVGIFFKSVGSRQKLAQKLPVLSQKIVGLVEKCPDLKDLDTTKFDGRNGTFFLPVSDKSGYVIGYQLQMNV